MRAIRVLPLLIVVAFLSCGDEGTSPGGGDETFQLQVVVNDASGAPIPGVRVSAWNKTPDWVAALVGYRGTPAPAAYQSHLPDDLPRLLVNMPNPFSTITTWRVYLPGYLSARLQLFDIEGNLDTTLLDDQFPAGMHTRSWQIHSASHASAVYEARFSVWTSTRDTLVFEDTLYAAFYRPEIEAHNGVIGFTDDNGLLVIADRLFFPGSYDLPPLEAVDEEGVSHGAFDFSDTAVFTLVDTSTGVRQVFEERITAGSNDLKLTWAR
ncbi:hypothetical protein ACFL6M_03045 [Candidatus Eisenbacteria bacterium]|uniref:Uncharacterized protein n=1 Tax=Eiseniibacteriota bacterium TaxID=2212470 RepID=A0ABV6YJP8_UNCEI